MVAPTLQVAAGAGTAAPLVVVMRMKTTLILKTLTLTLGGLLLFLVEVFLN